MAIEPVRPIGSTLTLRYVGTIVVGAAAQAAFPKANGELPSNVTTASEWNVRFLFADRTDPTDQSTRLAPTVYDDSQPAGASPHAPIVAGSTNQIQVATDQFITNRTWAQNLDVRVISAVPGGNASAVSFNVAGARVALDLADSGLGGNTGLPVLVLPVTVTFAGPGSPTVDVAIEVTIRHSIDR
ncbi:MAG: hypothetical protein ACRCSL_04705 [Microbacterium sp.]